MKKLKRVMFIYDDDSVDAIEDPRACLLFQSRANSGGLLSGMEEYIVPVLDISDESK